MSNFAEETWNTEEELGNNIKVEDWYKWIVKMCDALSVRRIVSSDRQTLVLAMFNLFG
jgi:hypothetical protein